MLADLSAPDRAAVLDLFELAAADEGDLLVEADQDGSSFQVLVSGRVSVERDTADGVHEVAQLAAGSVLGELSLLRGTSTTARVRALAPVTTARVPLPQSSLLLEFTAVRQWLEQLARRREATNRLWDAGAVETQDATGRRLVLRPLWPDDWRLMEAVRGRTSDASLRKRFFTLPKMHEGFLRRLAAVDYLDQFAWAVLDEDGMAAVGRYGRLPEDRDTAEMALLVADDLHRSGIGSLLVVALACAAVEHGITNLHGLALAQNTAVRDLLIRFGAEWHRGDGGTEIETTWPATDVLERAPHEQPVDELRATARTVLQG